MSVADVFELEVGDDGNYQGNNELTTEFSSSTKTSRVKKTLPGLMPDLSGLSLRKSLRLLQGITLNINIQGTGRVLDQKPRPGTSLKGLTECVLILEKQENIVPKKFSKGLPGKD